MSTIPSSPLRTAPIKVRHDEPKGLSDDLMRKLSTSALRTRFINYFRLFDHHHKRVIHPISAVRSIVLCGVPLTKSEANEVKTAYSNSMGEFEYYKFLADVNDYRVNGFFEKNHDVDPITSPYKSAELKLHPISPREGGTAGFYSPLTVSEEHRFVELLHELRKEVTHRGILIKLMLRPYDKVNRGLVIKTIFVREMSSLFPNYAFSDMELLGKAYSSHDGADVRYLVFHSDVTPASANDVIDLSRSSHLTKSLIRSVSTALSTSPKVKKTESFFDAKSSREAIGLSTAFNKMGTPSGKAVVGMGNLFESNNNSNIVNNPSNNQNDEEVVEVDELNLSSDSFGILPGSNNSTNNAKRPTTSSVSFSRASPSISSPIRPGTSTLRSAASNNLLSSPSLSSPGNSRTVAGGTSISHPRYPPVEPSPSQLLSMQASLASGSLDLSVFQGTDEEEMPPATALSVFLPASTPLGSPKRSNILSPSGRSEILSSPSSALSPRPSTVSSTLLLNPRATLRHNALGGEDVKAVEARIIRQIWERRAWLKDAFADFDILKRGLCTRSQFTRGLKLCKVTGIAPEGFDALADKYAWQGDLTGNTVDYFAFDKVVDEAFVEWGFEKNPDKRNDSFAYQVVSAPHPRFVRPVFTGEKKVNFDNGIKCIRDSIRIKRRYNLKPALEMFDKTKEGLVSDSQFLRVLSQYGIVPVVDKEREAVLDYYRATGANSHLIDYRAFLLEVYDSGMA